MSRTCQQWQRNSPTYLSDVSNTKTSAEYFYWHHRMFWRLVASKTVNIQKHDRWKADANPLKQIVSNTVQRTQCNLRERVGASYIEDTVVFVITWNFFLGKQLFISHFRSRSKTVQTTSALKSAYRWAASTYRIKAMVLVAHVAEKHMRVSTLRYMSPTKITETRPIFHKLLHKVHCTSLHNMSFVTYRDFLTQECYEKTTKEKISSRVGKFDATAHATLSYNLHRRNDLLQDNTVCICFSKSLFSQTEFFSCAFFDIAADTLKKQIHTILQSWHRAYQLSLLRHIAQYSPFAMVWKQSSHDKPHAASNFLNWFAAIATILWRRGHKMRCYNHKKSGIKSCRSMFNTSQHWPVQLWCTFVWARNEVWLQI